MELTPGQVKLLAYWGAIQSAVTRRVSTAELWDIVHNRATLAGAKLTGVSATDMGGLRSLVVGQRNAAEEFQKARIDDVITARMVGSDISARGPQDQALAPKYIFRFQHDVLVDGQLTTLWRSSTWDGRLPPTKSAIRAQLEQDGMGLADDYGTTHVGIGDISIVAV